MSNNYVGQCRQTAHYRLRDPLANTVNMIEPYHPILTRESLTAHRHFIPTSRCMLKTKHVSSLKINLVQPVINEHSMKFNKPT